MLFKKVDATVLDVIGIYGASAFLIYFAGSTMFAIGKECGKAEARKQLKDRDIIDYLKKRRNAES